MTSHPNRAISWLAVVWATLAPALIAFLLRCYSRCFLTRSIGSDDFAIAISMALTIVGASVNAIQVKYGLGQHELDVLTYSEELKWEYVAWLVVFINYFFLRASIMLFVLRLLPPHKKWQQRVIYINFFINFAITVIATVSYGLGCIPFKALYDPSVPNAKCYSKEKLVITAQINGIISCVTDITTAIIPIFLLWNVKMKPLTKYILHTIFGLGLITAAMSIGRAATTNNSSLAEDSTWRLLPSKWFSAIEVNFGVLFACCPAIRQLLTYHHRTGTYLPSSGQRQYPNEDFERMRTRVNIRDILWYRRAKLTNGRVVDATPIFKDSKDPEKTMARSEVVNEKRSVMDWWEGKGKKMFGGAEKGISQEGSWGGSTEAPSGSSRAEHDGAGQGDKDGKLQHKESQSSELSSSYGASPTGVPRPML